MLALAVLLASAPPRADAAGLPSPEQAAAEAFPDAAVSRRSWALTDAELDRVEELAGSRPDSRLVVGYVASLGGRPAGLALLDSHVVRTKGETLLVSMTPAREVVQVDVIAFAEPREYLPPSRWLAQVEGRSLDPSLELKRGLRGITGATLTSRAATAATRRCLALAVVLAERP